MSYYLMFRESFSTSDTDNTVKLLHPCCSPMSKRDEIIAALHSVICWKTPWIIKT